MWSDSDVVLSLKGKCSFVEQLDSKIRLTHIPLLLDVFPKLIEIGPVYLENNKDESAHKTFKDPRWRKVTLKIIDIEIPFETIIQKAMMFYGTEVRMRWNKSPYFDEQNLKHFILSTIYALCGSGEEVGEMKKDLKETNWRSTRL
jgi:hypothetical protein